MSEKKLDLSKINDTGAYSVYKQLWEHWSQMGEALRQPQLRKAGKFERSGSALQRYIGWLQSTGRILSVSIYVPNKAWGALPKTQLFKEADLHLLHNISQGRWLREDRRYFIREIREHRYFVCPECGFHFNPLVPFLPRTPILPRTCSKCGSLMVLIYFKVLATQKDRQG